MCKNMEKFLILVLFFVHRATATDIIYHLDDDDYFRIPPKNTLERFEPCVGVAGGVYCTAFADLVSDEPSELLDMIKGYSAHELLHLNYSNFAYGVCVTKSCQKYYHGDNSPAALQQTVEACLNETYSRDYDLKLRTTKVDCYHHGQQKEVDLLDIAVGILMGAIIAFNVLGTLYDFFRDENSPANQYLMAFSLRDNWRRMFTPPSKDPRVIQLRSINGVRVMTAIIVILGHVPVPGLLSIENPKWYEEMLRFTPNHIMQQGHLITLTFFMISGFLLTYNMCMEKERHTVTWRVLPKVIFVRWLRLSPVNITMLLLTVTWFKFSPVGPFWQGNVGKEVADCRDYWIYNVFYINNLFDHSQCNLQTWWLASDMQLHALGLALILLTSERGRKWAIWGLYVAGAVIPAYKIYTLDLYGTFLATPQAMITYFLSSSSFNYVYKRTYANMSSFAMGMFAGYWIYDLQKRNLIPEDNTKYRKYRYAYWTLPWLMFSVVTSAYFAFYVDGPPPSMMTRLLFAPIVKPLFTLIIMLIILGAIFKVEDTYRSLLEWDGWIPFSKISYAMYVTHVTLVRYLGGSDQTLTYFSFTHLTQGYVGVVLLTMGMALVMYLLVEAPFGGLIRILLSPSGGTKKKQQQEEPQKSQPENGHALKNGNGLKED